MNRSRYARELWITSPLPCVSVAVMSHCPQCELLKNDIAHYASEVALLTEQAASTFDPRLREDILVNYVS
jgi:hypothetical protein